MSLKILIHAIGTISEPELNSLNHEYIKRIRWPLYIKEFAQSNTGNINTNQSKEAQVLWPTDASTSLVITLDENGKQFTSLEFAALIGKAEDTATNKIYFLIGGPDGHYDTTFKRSDITMSLSKLTFPHKIARLLLIEQIYRAYAIRTGHPYHRS